MRFDDAGHIEAWQKDRAFPAIHRAIGEMVVNYSRGSRFLDLCCSYGLVGQYVAGALGATVVGVDRDDRVIERAREAGISIDLRSMRISPASLDELVALVREHKLTGIIARRALPELFDQDLEFGRAFAAAMREAGVIEVFLEGRVATKSAVSALASLEAEIRLLDPSFWLARRIRNCAHLRAR